MPAEGGEPLSRRPAWPDAVVLAWAREAGYTSVATDWRSTNLEADGAWRALGFRPTFRRLHRLID